MLHTLARTYEQTSQLLPAEKIYLRSLRIVETAEHNADVDALYIQVLASLARLYRTQGRYQEAEPPLKRALELAGENFGSDSLAAARALSNLAVLYQETRRFAQAGKLYERAVEIAEKAGDQLQLAGACRNLAALEHARGRNRAAEPYAQRAVDIREKALGPDDPEAASDVVLLAAILDRRKRFEEAEPLYRRVLKVFEKVYGREHAQVAAVLNNLAALYQARGEGYRPEQLYKRVLSIKEKALGPDHAEVATTLNNLAVLYKGLERYSEARPLYDRALAIFEKNLGAAHPKVAQALMNYAHLLRAEAEWLEKRARRIESDLKRTSADAGKQPRIDARIARFRLAVRPSRIHRWGVYAEETIPADQEVIEYTGARLSRGDAKRRSRRKLQYLFVVDKYWKIDGAAGGSGAQYINHSCAPNIVARKVDNRIFYFSKRRIEAGEELLVDYKFSKFAPKVPCHCGAANCRGTINLK